MVSEAELYAPVKALLEDRGYEVKAEVNGCDVVACKEGEPTVIVELKLTFSIDLLFQGIDRLTITDDVYLAILAPETAAKRKNWRARRGDCIKLCRRLGVGLMTVDPPRRSGAQVEVLLDPAPYAPRKNKRKQTRLMKEFTARSGDPNQGGITRTKIVTAYRQDAIRCAMVLADGREMKTGEIRAATGAPKTASILQKNYYGWFERTTRGVYRLTPSGHEGLQHYAEVLPPLADNPG
jgi:hypothetical protein